VSCYVASNALGSVQRERHAVLDAHARKLPQRELRHALGVQYVLFAREELGKTLVSAGVVASAESRDSPEAGCVCRSGVSRARTSRAANSAVDRLANTRSAMRPSRCPSIEPSEGSLDDPSLGHDLEAARQAVVRRPRTRCSPNARRLFFKLPCFPLPVYSGAPLHFVVYLCARKWCNRPPNAFACVGSVHCSWAQRLRRPVDGVGAGRGADGRRR